MCFGILKKNAICRNYEENGEACFFNFLFDNEPVMKI